MYIEVRKFNDKDENSLVEFFDLLVSKGLDKHFHPHLFTPEMAHHIANNRGIDWYAGVFLKSDQRETIIAYGMLRGWDEGFKIPSFGVCVLQDFQGIGIGHLMMNLTIINARLCNSPAILVKVFPENHAAVKFFQQIGFKFQEQLEQEQLVGYLSIS